LRRGALMFVRKPVTQEDVLDYVMFGLRNQRIDPAARSRQRARSTTARQRARDAAAALLRRLDLDAFRRRGAGQLPLLRSYFGVDAALSAFLHGEQLIVLDGDGEAAWRFGTDVTDRVGYCFEIIETGASLVLADASTHPSFVAAGGAMKDVRF